MMKYGEKDYISDLSTKLEMCPQYKDVPVLTVSRQE